MAELITLRPIMMKPKERESLCLLNYQSIEYIGFDGY
jgi:hypothetical protein